MIYPEQEKDSEEKEGWSPVPLNPGSSARLGLEFQGLLGFLPCPQSLGGLSGAGMPAGSMWWLWRGGGARVGLPPPQRMFPWGTCLGGGWGVRGRCSSSPPAAWLGFLQLFGLFQKVIPKEQKKELHGGFDQVQKELRTLLHPVWVWAPLNLCLSPLLWLGVLPFVL